MSNTENKNEQINNIKEINNFVDNKIKPLIDNIIESKSKINETLSKINNLRQAKVDKEAKKEDMVEKSVVVAQQKNENSKTAIAEDKIIAKEETTKILVKPEVAINESNEAKSIEIKSSEVQNHPIKEKEIEDKKLPRTYVNPDMAGKTNQNNNPRYNNTRPQGESNYNRPQGQTNYNNTTTQGQSNYNNTRPAGTGSYNNSRPAGAGGYNNTRPAGAGGYNNTRPAGAGGYNNTRPAGVGGYNNTRPAGVGGYNNTRPAGAGGYNNSKPAGAGGYNNTRPAGTGGYNNTRTQGQGNFITRPRLDSTAALPITQKKDTTKKKVSDIAPKNDSRKTLSKRDLMKKGYQVDSTLTNDNETIRFKTKKSKRELNFTPKLVKIENAVLNYEYTPIKIFSEKIGKPAIEIIKKLFDMGKFVTINDSISFEDAEFVALDYGITLELNVEQTAEDMLANIVADNEDVSNFVKRPPIVTIMGHVDHGKTSLLDYIRKSKVVQNEFGGITQHIGAYTIELKGEKITFLDTPGHEAFTSMRRRGAKVTDIAIIVVAADDGIMPQTIEAINHSKEAGVSIIVAVNKIDKTDGNLDKIKQQLSVHNVLSEDWGGDTMVCPVSAKTGQGVNELLENILLLAEVLELKANKKCNASGSIIEARLDKGIGPVATVLVQNGTLKVKDYIVAGTSIGKIRAMTDHLGRSLKEATPSTAVQIQGFSEVPNAGDIIVAVKAEKLAKQVAQERADKERAKMSMKSNARSLEDMFKDAESSDMKILPIVIKADVQGSAEAVKQSLLKLSEEMVEENVKIHIIHCGVGAINESDVMLADTSNAIVIAFNVRPEPKAKMYAEKSKVEIKPYSIIYDAIDDVEKALKGMFITKFKENMLGHAEIRTVFKLSTNGTIAGSYITDGKVSRNCNVRLMRDNVVVYEGKISSLRREKDDVKDVATGYECGIGLDKFDDIKTGDIIECFIMEKINKK